jgi:hypothetical protein
MGLQYPWTLANRTSEGKLVRGLDNLKALYVVDGSILGQEGREKHLGNCNYILKEVAEGKAPHPGLRSGTLVPWNSWTAHVIRLALNFEETPYDNTWEPPKVIFKELIPKETSITWVWFNFMVSRILTEYQCSCVPQILSEHLSLFWYLTQMGEANTFPFCRPRDKYLKSLVIVQQLRKRPRRT